MIITLTYTKEELHHLVNQQTIYISDPVGTKEANTINRIADIIPLTNDDKDFFNTSLYQVGNKVLTKLAYDVEDIEVPFIISGNNDPEYPDPLVMYKFNLYSGANELVVVPQVQQAVSMALINGIIEDWLTVKGFFQQALVYKEKYENALFDIKSAMMYGQKTTKTYRTL